ncbi:MAG: PorT family protein [Chitinophagaceae bacterium]|nr:PorT family protein [Chitinophagaceae bacterium]
MKSKIILLGTLMFFSFITLQAQVNFGIKAGPTFTTWRGDATGSMNEMIDATNGILKTQGKTGFFAGLSATIPLGGIVSIEPAVLYAQKGYQLSGDYSIDKLDFVGINASAKVNSHYIDIPLLLKVEPSKGFQVFAGPQVSFLVQSDMKVDAGALGFSFFKRTMDISDQMNSIDVGLTGGLGYQFTNGFSVSASYDHGLNRLDKNENFKAYNQAFKVGVGFNF